MNLIDQYIESLTEHLGRNVAQTKEQIAEIRTHLEMDALDRATAGESQAESELAACKAMGSPQIIANQIIRQARGYATASPWRLSWPCGVFLTLAMVIPYSMLGNLHYQSTADTLVRWAPFFALLFFGWTVVRTKRWLVLPMSAWASITTIGVLVGSISTTAANPTPAQLESVRANALQELSQVKSEQILVDKWKNGSPPLNKSPLLGAADATFVIPFVPLAIGGTDQSLALEASSPTESALRWAKYGAMYAADVQDRKRSLEESLIGAPTPALSKTEITMNVFKLWTMFTAYQVLVFLVVNAGLLALIRTRDKKTARREPLFAR